MPSQKFCAAPKLSMMKTARSITKKVQKKNKNVVCQRKRFQTQTSTKQQPKQMIGSSSSEVVAVEEEQQKDDDDDELVVDSVTADLKNITTTCYSGCSLTATATPKDDDDGNDDDDDDGRSCSSNNCVPSNDVDVDDKNKKEFQILSSSHRPSVPTVHPPTRRPRLVRRIVCDFYGLPKERRPRKEKILAIARQIVNFLVWQQQQQQQQAKKQVSSSDDDDDDEEEDAVAAVIKKGKFAFAEIVIVGCNNSNKNGGGGGSGDDNKDNNNAAQQTALLNRMKQLWDDEQQQQQRQQRQQQQQRHVEDDDNGKSLLMTSPFPSHLTFSDEPLTSFLLRHHHHHDASTRQQGQQQENDEVIDNKDSEAVVVADDDDDDDRGLTTTTCCNSGTITAASTSQHAHATAATPGSPGGVVYLSPDAQDVLDVDSSTPPHTVIVGLIIDRNVQLNRSLNRASSLDIPSARWLLEECIRDVISNDEDSADGHAEQDTMAIMNQNEPLNVDCILEGMQQWYWNVEQHEQQQENHNTSNGATTTTDQATSRNQSSPSSYRQCFVDAATQAVKNHRKRHSTLR